MLHKTVCFSLNYLAVYLGKFNSHNLQEHVQKAPKKDLTISG